MAITIAQLAKIREMEGDASSSWTSEMVRSVFGGSGPKAHAEDFADAVLPKSLTDLVKPQPIAPENNLALLELSEAEKEYEALAQSLGFEPIAMRKRRNEILSTNRWSMVNEYMVDHGLPIYSEDDVKKYMDQVLKIEQRNLIHGELLQWVWAPITSYRHAIPVEMLHRAKKVKDYFSDAVFFVTDYKVSKPDPFISFTLPDMVNDKGRMRPVIFGVWDEPGFGLDK